MVCDRKFGCHSCSNTLMTLHACIRQILTEPQINHEKIRKELISVKRFIEDVVGVGEDTL
jgi:Fe-S cluster biogenesis protein NfuA